jgi:hypothetical protein
MRNGTQYKVIREHTMADRLGEVYLPFAPSKRFLSSGKESRR